MAATGTNAESTDQTAEMYVSTINLEDRDGC
jgi:hypothetical protein